MKKASAIVTDEGGRACHAAIISRELGIPCVVGTEKATKLLKSGEEITVDCTQGFACPLPLFYKQTFVLLCLNFLQ